MRSSLRRCKSDDGCSVTNANTAYEVIDTTFPKGQAFGDWLLFNGAAMITPGIGTTADFPGEDYDLQASGPPAFPQSTRWIYGANGPDPGVKDYSTLYMSFNTPVSQPASNQCGRAVFSDLHLSGNSAPMQFPTECGQQNPVAPGYDSNETAIEFLFFDLSTCIQDDTQPPPPPTNQ